MSTPHRGTRSLPRLTCRSGRGTESHASFPLSESEWPQQCILARCARQRTRRMHCMGRALDPRPTLQTVSTCENSSGLRRHVVIFPLRFVHLAAIAACNRTHLICDNCRQGTTLPCATSSSRTSIRITGQWPVAALRFDNRCCQCSSRPWS